MEEMTVLLLHTSFVTNNYQVLGCYVIRFFLCTLSQCMPEVCEHCRNKPFNKSLVCKFSVQD